MKEVSSRQWMLQTILSVSVCTMLIGCASPKIAISSAWDRASTFPIVALPELPAATSEEPPDESVKLLRREPEETGREPNQRSKLRPGLRAGMVLPASAKDSREWKGAPSAGLLFRQRPSSPRATVIELGADFAEAETEDGVRSSQLLFLRAELLTGRFAPSGAAPYFLAGAQAVLEQSTNNVTGESASGRGAAVELGLGYGAKNGRWDARLTYALFVASENIEGSLIVSMGLGF